MALAALMRIPRDRVAWLGAEALRRLSGADPTPQQRYLLTECVQAYLPMDEQQKQEYQQFLEKDEYREVRQMNKTVFEEGLEKGLEKGRLLERRELALALLEERIGPPSAKLRAHIESLPMEPLRRLMLKIAKATSLGEAGLSQFAE